MNNLVDWLGFLFWLFWGIILGPYLTYNAFINWSEMAQRDGGFLCLEF